MLTKWLLTFATFSASVLAGEPSNKLPPPSIEEQKAAEKVIRELYKEDFAKSSTRDRLALANKLDSIAAETTDDNTARYELRDLAAGLAAAAGEPEVMLSILDSLTLEYDGDFKELKKRNLTTAASATKTPRGVKLLAAYRKLVDTPDDPASNMVVGKYKCFIKGDWSDGITELARGSGPLSEVARREAAGADTSEAQILMGDAWWDQGEKEAEKEDKALCQARAAYWYTTALPSQTGIMKVKFEKRVATADAANSELLASQLAVPAPPPAPTVQKPLESVFATEEMWRDPAPWEMKEYKVSRRLSQKQTVVKSIKAGAKLVASKTEPAMLEIDQGSKVSLDGLEPNPVSVERISLAVSNKSLLLVKWTSFLGCVFRIHAGSVTLQSKMRAQHSVFFDCVLHADPEYSFGVLCTNCFFVESKFPEGNGGGPTTPDFSSPAHTKWNTFSNCVFIDCEISPRLFWCTQQCTFINCKFLPNKELTGKDDIEIEAHVIGGTGAPQVGTGVRKAKVTLVKTPWIPSRMVDRTFTKASAKIQPTFAGKTPYVWVSKSATYTASSIYDDDKPHVNLLNGVGGAYGAGTYSFQTNAEENPWIIVDLGRRRAVNALEIGNRVDEQYRSATLYASISDTPNGPWTEVWAAGKPQIQWQAILDRPRPTRYVKLGLKSNVNFHLNEVKVFAK